MQLGANSGLVERAPKLHEINFCLISKDKDFKSVKFQ